ncbi:DUF551 domain-containing protein [Candidatus Ventrimonas sp.]|uniref:DUF551 domain-containing protein n=1 Tax=Candidatus Ventrimonas sp. TaxID=3048889 RepID=UPI003AB5383E
MMNRLTQKRVNGIKTGYWSAGKKDELVARLAEYEDTGLEPAEVLQLKKNTVQWIPVAERMPERNKSVLLCMKSRSSRTGMCIQTGSYDNGFWFIQGAAGYESLATFEFHVLAWMPLPEPYRGGEYER